MLYNFNLLGIYFLISNLLVSFIIGPIIIISCVCIIISFVSFPISKIIGMFLNFGINLLINISKISYLPFSKIYVPTPNEFLIVMYFIIAIILNQIYLIYNSKFLNPTSIRIKNLISLFKYRIKQKRKYKLKIVSVLLIIFLFVQIIIPKNLKIYFVDVGQGDCTFIVTPNNKTILIDGGGSDSKEFDVGKSTLLPYILDRGVTKIDYIVITHFDQDHVGGILTILEELKVGKVYIPKQIEDSDNYKRFVDIVKNKKISVKILKKGDILKFDNNISFEILWPSEKQIKENVLNNNSIVAKLKYNNFEVLFTGDIEKIAEEEILKEYSKNLNKLKATVLKIAHHGSKTSTTSNFLRAVNPKICLIGVGKNNLFNHPSNEVLNRLEHTKIYRTDQDGEIILQVNSKRRN